MARKDPDEYDEDNDKYPALKERKYQPADGPTIWDLFKKDRRKKQQKGGS